ncbi:MAG: DUF2165 family protein [Bacillota bacterium]|nr:DUF2165 family protein [Bacillota bacterium]MDW7682881.1 DUF2165 family protein [Bacillota bacterium]
MTIQSNQWFLWFMLTVFLYIAMILIIPQDKIRRLVPFGFWFGFIMAIVITGFFQTLFNAFRLVGDPTVLGIPVFTPLAWVPPTIAFAVFFPHHKPWYYYPGYILIFITGAVAVQLGLEWFGMWQSIRWNPFLTALLASLPHSLMTIYLAAKKVTIH